MEIKIREWKERVFLLNVLEWRLEKEYKDKTINKIRKAHHLQEIKVFDVQLCGKLEVTRENFEKLSYPRICEYKYDGERCIITVVEGKVTLQSRAGKDITSHYPEVINMLEDRFNSNIDLVLDSEIISSSFIKLSTRMHRKAENIEEHDDSLRPIFFDILSFDNIDVTKLSQEDRRRHLTILASEHDLELSYLKIVNTVDELLQFYKDARAIEQEGVVTKDLDGKWIPGDRRFWTKMVPKESADLKVIEGYYGTGKK